MIRRQIFSPKISETVTKLVKGHKCQKKKLGIGSDNAVEYFQTEILQLLKKIVFTSWKKNKHMQKVKENKAENRIAIQVFASCRESELNRVTSRRPPKESPSKTESC